MFTWSIIENPELRLFLGQHAEHHDTCRFTRAVEHPGGKRLQSTQRAHVHHTAAQTHVSRKHLQDPSSQTQRWAHVHRQIPVHFVHVSETSGVAWNIAQWSLKKGNVSTKLFRSHYNQCQCSKMLPHLRSLTVIVLVFKRLDFESYTYKSIRVILAYLSR